jgi:hypothetical protein
MEDEREQVVSSPTELRSAEERMLGTELVREMAARGWREVRRDVYSRETPVGNEAKRYWAKAGEGG